MAEFSGNLKGKIPISLATYKSEMEWIQTNKKLANKLKSLSEKFYSEKKGNIKKFKYFQDNNETLGIDASLENYTAICSSWLIVKYYLYDIHVSKWWSKYKW